MPETVTYRNVPQVVQYQGELAGAQAGAAMQQGDQGREVRPKAAGRHLGRAFRAHRHLAVGTGDRRELVFGDRGHHRRQLPDLLTEDGTGGGQLVGQTLLTVRTGRRRMDHQLGDLLGREQVAVLPGVTGLRAAFAAR